MRFKIALLPLTMPLVLAACLGGGGGSGGSSSGQSGPLTLGSTPTADFTSFSDIEANSLVEATAPTSVNYAADVVGGNVDRGGVLSDEGSSLRILTGDAINPDDLDAGLEFDGLRLTVNLPGDATIVRDFFDEPTDVGDYGRFQNLDDADEVTDRLFLNEGEDLEYMVFGVWEIGLGEATIDMGGAAWGALTPTAGDNPMPPAGTASYAGELIGYNFTGGATTVYIADSTLAANFGADTVSLTASNTRSLIGAAPSPGLDIVASPGTISGNGFTGAAINLQAQVDNPLLDFAGSYGGAFYGPDAAEAGGWFEVRNVDNNDRYFGSFGGERGAIIP